MFRTVYYIIRPNNALAEHLAACDEEWASLLVEPTMWSRQEGEDVGYTISAWNVLRGVQVKMLFMIDMASEYLSSSGPETADFRAFVYELLELPGVKAETFDKWWSLERVDGLANTYEDVLARLTKREVEAMVIPHVGGAFEWIAELKGASS